MFVISLYETVLQLQILEGDVKETTHLVFIGFCLHELHCGLLLQSSLGHLLGHLYALVVLWVLGICHSLAVVLADLIDHGTEHAADCGGPWWNLTHDLFELEEVPGLRRVIISALDRLSISGGCERCLGIL